MFACILHTAILYAFCCTVFAQQNLGEAEYVVACYQYMRLLGYPAEKIAILTTYNGQRALIGDVLQQVCMHTLLHTTQHATVHTYSCSGSGGNSSNTGSSPGSIRVVLAITM
jgi:hypothetical protein